MKKIKKSNNSRKHAKTVRRRTIVAAKNRQNGTPVASQVSRVRTTASNYALIYCCMTPNIFDIGIGYVVLGRKLSLDRIATSVFMVDVYCLGVKNAFMSNTLVISSTMPLSVLAGLTSFYRAA